MQTLGTKAPFKERWVLPCAEWGNNRKDGIRLDVRHFHNQPSKMLVLVEETPEVVQAELLRGMCATLKPVNGDSWYHMCAFRFHFWGRQANWNQASHVRASSVVPTVVGARISIGYVWNLVGEVLNLVALGTSVYSTTVQEGVWKFGERMYSVLNHLEPTPDTIESCPPCPQNMHKWLLIYERLRLIALFHKGKKEKRSCFSQLPRNGNVYTKIQRQIL